jgi:hypothetical protein
MKDMYKVDVLKEGDPNCKHPYNLWMRGSGGQALWCDVSGCGRHVRTDQPYDGALGRPIPFPSEAFVRTPVHGFVYVYQANKKGLVDGKILPPEKRVSMSDLGGLVLPLPGELIKW